MYVAYWYSNYRKEGREIAVESLMHSKAEIYRKHAANFQDRKAKMIAKSNDLGAAETILRFMEGKDFERKQVFTKENLIKDIGQQPFIKGLTVGQAKHKIQSSLRALKSDISEFNSSLDDLNSKIWQFLGGKEVQEAFQQQAIDEYAKSKGISKRKTSDLRKAILDDVLNSTNAFVALPKPKSNGSSALNTSITKLLLLAYALPEYGKYGSAKGVIGKTYSTGGKGGKDIDSATKFLQVLSGKVSGLFNNVSGLGAEIAWAKVELAAKGKLEEELAKIAKKSKGTVVIGKDIRITASTSGQEAAVEKGDGVSGVSKSDVNVKITADGVLIEYGVSVKQATIPASGNPKIKLVDSTPLMPVLRKVFGGGDFEYFYNVLAGLSDDKVSEGELAKKMREVIQVTGALYALDAMAGFANNNKDNVLYLAVNGNIVPIEKILNSIATGDMRQNAAYTRVHSASGNSLKRDSFTRINKARWITPHGDTRGNILRADLSKKRSSAVEKEITDILNQQKLTMTMSILRSLI